MHRSRDRVPARRIRCDVLNRDVVDLAVAAWRIRLDERAFPFDAPSDIARIDERLVGQVLPAKYLDLQRHRLAGVDADASDAGLDSQDLGERRTRWRRRGQRRAREAADLHHQQLAVLRNLRLNPRTRQVGRP